MFPLKPKSGLNGAPRRLRSSYASFTYESFDRCSSRKLIQGAEAHLSDRCYAALKGRSSTFGHALSRTRLATKDVAALGHGSVIFVARSAWIMLPLKPKNRLNGAPRHHLDSCASILEIAGHVCLGRRMLHSGRG